MATIYIDAIYATFAVRNTTFETANNKITVDPADVGTSNRSLIVDGNPDPNYFIGLGKRYCASGQHITNIGNGLSYSILQPVLKFEIPLDGIKTINSAKITFQVSSLINQAHANDPLVTQGFNLRVVQEFKRYPPNIISTLPLLGNLNNLSSYGEVIIPNAVDYINSYNFYLIFSESNQENNICSLPNPSLGDANARITQFQYARLIIDYEPVLIVQGLGFRHFEFNGSGMIERPGNGTESIVLSNSGFARVSNRETVGCGIIYPGSGYQLREFDIICAQRILAFSNLSEATLREIELEVPPIFQSNGLITVYRWNSPPTSTNRNYSSVGTLPSVGGKISIPLEPGKVWVHFAQSRSDGTIRPIRLTDSGTKISSLGF